VSAQRKLYFSSVEFRPKPAETAEAMHLGWLLEFTTPVYWVVGLVMRAVLDTEAMARLDPLSRELLENRAKLFEIDIDQALRAASEPGDVLKALSSANPWSVHITAPSVIPTAEAKVGKSASIEQALEQFILTVFRRALAGHMPAQPRVRASTRVGRAALLPAAPAPPVETPPPWMLPARHWARLLHV
jgi:hypothetical protein